MVLQALLLWNLAISPLLALYGLAVLIAGLMQRETSAIVVGAYIATLGAAWLGLYWYGFRACGRFRQRLEYR
jgi:hypothetical protein